MKILFSTDNKTAVSTFLNLQNLENLNRIKNIRFTAFDQRFEDYDVVLLMGYDHDVKAVKKKNPDALVGVIDPRPPQKNQPQGADFILANGIEMADYYYQFCEHIFIYYIYPICGEIKKEHNGNHRRIKIGYHGNKIHLESAFPRITDALEEVGLSYDIELTAIYNIQKLGKISWKPKRFELNPVQWSEKCYDEHLSKVDIGIVPNIMPVRNGKSIKKKAATFLKKYNEHETDYLLRFKASCNPGRLFPFMRYGIPVVSDMFPSAFQIIDDGVDSFIAYNTKAWSKKMFELARDAELRREMGSRFRKKFENRYSTQVMNEKLVGFLSDLLKQKKGML